MSWFYSRNGQQVGPVAINALQGMYASGQLLPTDLVWTEGMTQWLPASNVPAITGGAGAAPAPQAPPVGYYNPRGQAYGANFSGDGKNAMILGILGICCCGFFTGIPALIIGNNAMKKMKASGNMDGYGMAKAGFIMGIISIILSAISIMINLSRM